VLSLFGSSLQHEMYIWSPSFFHSSIQQSC
jgi:hypothetical protein